MKKICLVNFVFGKDYQAYIPLYLLFAKSTYPEYNIRIYIDKFLNRDIKAQIDILTSEYEGITIIENYDLQSNLCESAKKIPQIRKCQRWMLYDKEFLDYEYLYIGDIDILLCKEEYDLCDQHLLHCEALGLPYSNITRCGDKKNYRKIYRNIVNYGMLETARYYLFFPFVDKKLSGLHFIKTDEYYKKLLPIIPDMYKELNMLSFGKSKQFSRCRFNNESFLRTMLDKAGLGVCEFQALSKNDLVYNCSTDATSILYRPHHGIHLGIFRGMVDLIEDGGILDSALYLQYYSYFISIKSRKLFKEISPYFSDELCCILSAMENYYSKKHNIS